MHLIEIIVGHFRTPMCIGSDLVKLGIGIVPIVIRICKINGSSIACTLLHIIGFYAISASCFPEAIGGACAVGGYGLGSTVICHGCTRNIYTMKHIQFPDDFPGGSININQIAACRQHTIHIVFPGILVGGFLIPFKRDQNKSASREIGCFRIIGLPLKMFLFLRIFPTVFFCAKRIQSDLPALIRR